MTASTDAAIAMPAGAVASFAFDQPLLSNGPHFSTGDYHAARRHIESTSHGFFDFSLQRAREFRQYDVRSARLGDSRFNLIQVDSVSGYDIDMMNDPDLVLLQILMRGNAQLQQGSTTVDAAPAQMVLLEGVARSHKRWHGSTRLLMVSLSRSRMERLVASETGVGIGNPLSFGVMQVLDLERVSTLWHYIVTICRDLSGPQPCFEGRLGQLAERTLLLLLLNTVPNNYQWAFNDEAVSSPAPYYVRRIENYIRGHAHDPISAEDLVSVGGVSARSIYNGFQRFRSTTPMGYLKAVRLDMARDALIRGRRQGTTSVTQAATAAGYGNLSQFSRDYKARFREAPSRTLAGA